MDLDGAARTHVGQNPEMRIAIDTIEGLCGASDIIDVIDADTAGSKATIRGVDLIMENGLDVGVRRCPKGKTPTPS